MFNSPHAFTPYGKHATTTVILTFLFGKLSCHNLHWNVVQVYVFIGWNSVCEMEKRTSDMIQVHVVSS